MCISGIYLFNLQRYDMSKQAVKALADKIYNDIKYCRKEFDLTYVECVGVFTVFVWSIIEEAFERELEEQEMDDILGGFGEEDDEQQ
jgi:hypothetical protein